ncbi:hypothetical protein B0H34DRAFT_666136 [Crassisporium funariophilum]|nr:hypothetical protein B0H34DRAFT_666136 [Crassisporium funariophilum]
MTSIRAAGPVLLQRLQQGLSQAPVEFVYRPHPRWPFPHPSIQRQHLNRPLRISVLDSSFNPPTLAHLALANSQRPFNQGIGNDGASDYDAKLLLLSVTNADKSLKTGDATYLQRLEMMALLAKHIESRTQPPPTSSQITSQSLSPEEIANVAIAIIDEPTFVGKSEALLKYLKDADFTPEQQPELTFLVGLDTLERLFSPRYYASEPVMMSSLRKFLSPGPEGDNSRIVCAKRISAPPSPEITPNETAEDIKAFTLANEFTDSGRIVIIHIGDSVSTYSSSAVRGAIGRFGLGGSENQESLWRNFVLKDIADYVTKERLYVQP